MEVKNLGKTHYKISKIGLGTVQFGVDYGFTKKKSQEEVNEILNCAIESKINFIDTAREYGDSEKKIGKFISENKNELIIATKLKKIARTEKLSFRYLKGCIFKSIEDSMLDLKLQKIDVLQLHQADDYLISNLEFWDVVERLKAEKIIGSFGVSLYEEDEMEYLTHNYYNLIDFFQVPYNIFDRRFIRLEELLNHKSIGIISRSTFLKGVIPCDIEDIPKGLERIKSYKKKLKDISNELSISVEELALIFVYYNSLISSTILGVDSAKELELNVQTINKYTKEVLNNRELMDLYIEDLNLIDPRKWSNF